MNTSRPFRIIAHARPGFTTLQYALEGERDMDEMVRFLLLEKFSGNWPYSTVDTFYNDMRLASYSVNGPARYNFPPAVA